MNRSTAVARIRELKDALNEHNRKYYVLNAPDISDFEYDLLLQELTTLEKMFPDLASDDSPTRKVGSDISPKTTLSFSSRTNTLCSRSATRTVKMSCSNSITAQAKLQISL